MEIISTEKAPAAIGPYSQGMKTNELLFTSGQIPIDPATGQVVEAEITVQAKQSIENVGAVLAAGGSSFEKVIKTTCFLADMKDLRHLMKFTQNTLPPIRRAPVLRLRRCQRVCSVKSR